MLDGAPTITTIEDAAKYPSMNPLTLRRLARDGGIPAFKLGGQWRIRRGLLEQQEGNLHRSCCEQSCSRLPQEPPDGLQFNDDTLVHNDIRTVLAYNLTVAIRRDLPLLFGIQHLLGFYPCASAFSASNIF